MSSNEYEWCMRDSFISYCSLSLSRLVSCYQCRFLSHSFTIFVSRSIWSLVVVKTKWKKKWNLHQPRRNCEVNKIEEEERNITPVLRIFEPVDTFYYISRSHSLGHDSYHLLNADFLQFNLRRSTNIVFHCQLYPCAIDICLVSSYPLDLTSEVHFSGGFCFCWCLLLSFLRQKPRCRKKLCTINFIYCCIPFRLSFVTLISYI